MSSFSGICDSEYVLNQVLSSNNVLKERNSELEKENEDLKNQLYNSKLFTNMVIHEMRNPTSAIKEGMKEAI